VTRRPVAPREFVDAHTQRIVGFCQELVRRPSPNPPGDTRLVADAVASLVAEHGHRVEEIADQAHTPNLVSSVTGAAAGRHLVLCGHMDTYPVGDESSWSVPPYDARIDGGILAGRGAGDMKSGLASLVWAFLALANDPARLAGRLTLLAVSDEMSFSPHGAPLVLERRPELAGDAMIGAEPTSPDFVLFGEKGMAWVELTAHGSSAASAFAVGADNAIETLSRVVTRLAAWRDTPVRVPEQITRALRDGGGSHGLDQAALTYVDDRLLDRPTISVGTIRGGRKINLVADACQAEVDLRLAPGMQLVDAFAFLDGVVAAEPRVSYRVIQAMEPNWSDPTDALFDALVDAGERVMNTRPRLELGITASDTRLWRARGVPAAMIGPRIHGQGQPDESVRVPDLAVCTAIITDAAVRLLGGDAA
jgi:succinyl-diaminopimelate desuccinylase